MESGGLSGAQMLNSRVQAAAAEPPFGIDGMATACGFIHCSLDSIITHEVLLLPSSTLLIAVSPLCSPPYSISKVHYYLGEGFGCFMWLWVFHRTRMDGSAVLGYRHKFEH